MKLRTVALSIILASSNLSLATPCSKLLDQFIINFKSQSSLDVPFPTKTSIAKFEKELHFPIKKMYPLASGDYVITLDAKRLQAWSLQHHLSKEAYIEKTVTSIRQNPNVNYIDRDMTQCIDDEDTAQFNLKHYPSYCRKNLNAIIAHSTQWFQFTGMGYPGLFLESSAGARDGAWAITMGNAQIAVSNFEPINPNPELLPHQYEGWSFSKNSTDVSNLDNKHGTNVAGTILSSGLSEGILGVAPMVRLVPIEIGAMSNIIDAIYWAMGKPVARVPKINEHPVKVINMSFRYDRSQGCPQGIQKAIDEFVLSYNGTIAVSAGNDNDDSSFVVPRACNNVIIVGAVDRTGARSTFSSFGPRVSLAAAGGRFPIPSGSLCDEDNILTTTNLGVGCQDTNYVFSFGTSFATPLVSGVASLLYSFNPNMNSETVHDLLLASVIAFPNGSPPDRSCTGNNSCGVGILNANNALTLARDRTYVIAAPSPVQMDVKQHFDPYASCSDNQYVITEKNSVSPFPNIQWAFDARRACQTIDKYENPQLTVNGQQLIATYGVTTATLVAPDAVRCSVLNTHAFECH